MPRKRTRPSDADNPEWTKTDFARAKPLQELHSPKVLSAFKQFRGPQKTPRKVPVSIRLSPEVVRYFKASGRGWQARIDAALLKVATPLVRRRVSSVRRKTKAA